MVEQQNLITKLLSVEGLEQVNSDLLEDLVEKRGKELSDRQRWFAQLLGGLMRWDGSRVFSKKHFEFVVNYGDCDLPARDRQGILNLGKELGLIQQIQKRPPLFVFEPRVHEHLCYISYSQLIKDLGLTPEE